jgi:hypothetical protein
METIIKGGNLMVFLSDKSIPLATNHTLRISGETNDTSNKDVSAGMWAASTLKTLSWEVTTDNLYSIKGVQDLFDVLLNAQPVPIAFTTKTQIDDDPLPGTGTWTPDKTIEAYFHGNAILTSLEMTAQNGENATFSATFQGVGALSRDSQSPSGDPATAVNDEGTHINP